MPFRFLHLADIHLDTTFLCRSDSLRGRLRQALRTAFERAIDCAIDERVDAVLIAGDLFDNDRLSIATEGFLTTQVGRLHQARIPCCYVTGNHDPGARAARAARIAWPDTFHALRDRGPRPVEILGDGGTLLARIVGAGHVTAREQENLAAAFPPAADGVPHVGLLHTMVASAGSLEGHQRYAPCATDDLRRPGYRYWALGHIHLRQQVCDVSHAYYAGNLQGRNPRETGAKGGLLVTVRDGYAPEVAFRRFAPVQWEALRLDALEEVHTLADLERQVRSAFEDRDSSIDWLLRVTLAGPCPLAGELADPAQREELEETLARALDVVDVEVKLDRVTLPVDVAEHRGQTHLLGEVLAMLEELENDPRLLEAVAPQVLAAAVEDRGAYLRSLLGDLDREAALRLLAR